MGIVKWWLGAPGWIIDFAADHTSIGGLIAAGLLGLGWIAVTLMIVLGALAAIGAVGRSFAKGFSSAFKARD